MKKSRYTAGEIQRHNFIQFPKFLLDPEFKKLNGNAKILYALLRDRLTLSEKNGWVNDKNEVFVIFTREEMVDTLNLHKETVIKLMNDLREIGLIDEQRFGLAKANHIYLLAIETRPDDDFLKSQKDPSRTGNIPVQEGKKTDSKNPKVSESGSDTPHHQGREKTDFKRSEIPTSRVRKFRLQEVGNSDPIKTDLNQTYINHTLPPSVPPSPNDSKAEPEKTIKASNKKKGSGDSSLGLSLDKTTILVKEQISYDTLVSTHGRGYIDEIVHVISHTIHSVPASGRWKIGQFMVPIQDVRAIFCNLSSDDVEFFLSNFAKEESRVIKRTPYIRSSLFQNFGVQKARPKLIARSKFADYGSSQYNYEELDRLAAEYADREAGSITKK
jgi:hypothetical protein